MTQFVAASQQTCQGSVARACEAASQCPASWARKRGTRAIVASVLTVGLIGCAILMARNSSIESNSCLDVYHEVVYDEITAGSGPSQDELHQTLPELMFDPRAGDYFRLLQVRSASLSELTQRSRGSPTAKTGSTVPVLFVHGHRGQFGQGDVVVALLDEALGHYRQLHGQPSRGAGLSMPVYTIDYNSGSSAFHAGLLLAYAWHVNNCIRRILIQEQLLFAQRHHVHLSGADKLPGFPRQVLLLAHSQGGVASRLAPLLPNHPRDAISAMFLVNSPLQGHPFTADLRLATVNRIVNCVWAAAANSIPGSMLPLENRWKSGIDWVDRWIDAATGRLPRGGHKVENLAASVSSPSRLQLYEYYASAAGVSMEWFEPAVARTQSVAVLSMSTGGSDIVVRPELAILAGIGEPKRSISFLSSGVAGAWIGTLHNDVLACGQTAAAITRALVLAGKTVAKSKELTASAEQAELLVHRMSSTLGLGAGEVLSAAAGATGLAVSPLTAPPDGPTTALAKADVLSVRATAFRLQLAATEKKLTSLMSSPPPLSWYRYPSNASVEPSVSYLLWRMAPQNARGKREAYRQLGGSSNSGRLLTSGFGGKGGAIAWRGASCMSISGDQSEAASPASARGPQQLVLLSNRMEVRRHVRVWVEDGDRSEKDGRGAAADGSRLQKAPDVSVLWSPVFRGADRATFAPAGVRWVDLPDYMRRTHRHRKYDYSLRSSAWMSLGDALGPAARARYGGTYWVRNYVPSDLFAAVDTAGKHSMLVVDSSALSIAASDASSNSYGDKIVSASARLCVGFGAESAEATKNSNGLESRSTSVPPWVGIDDEREAALGFDEDGVTVAGTTRFVLAKLQAAEAQLPAEVEADDDGPSSAVSGSLVEVSSPAGAYVSSSHHRTANAEPLNSISIWKLLWPAAAPRRWTIPKHSNGGSIVVRLPLAVTPSPLLQYRLQVLSQSCSIADGVSSGEQSQEVGEDNLLEGGGGSTGPLWWPVAYYASTSPYSRCFACEGMFLGATGLPPPAAVSRALEKTAFDQALHAPAGYYTEHRLSTHALRPHIQANLDFASSHGLSMVASASYSVKSELFLVADPQCSYSVHLGAPWMSALGEVMLHRGSWLITAGVAVTLLVIAAQHQEWWHRLVNRKGEMKEWSLRRRKVSLRWIAGLQKYTTAMEALVAAVAQELRGRISMPRKYPLRSVAQSDWPSHPDARRGSLGAPADVPPQLGRGASATQLFQRLQSALVPVQPPPSQAPPPPPTYPSAMSTLRLSFFWILSALLVYCWLMWAVGGWLSPPLPWATDVNPTTFDARPPAERDAGNRISVGAGSSTPMEWTKPSLVEHILMHVFALGFGFMLLLTVDCSGKVLHLAVQGLSFIVSAGRGITWTCSKHFCPSASRWCQQCLHNFGQPCYCCLPSNTDEVTSARIFGWRRRARTRTVSVDELGPFPESGEFEHDEFGDHARSGIQPELVWSYPRPAARRDFADGQEEYPQQEPSAISRVFGAVSRFVKVPSGTSADWSRGASQAAELQGTGTVYEAAALIVDAAMVVGEAAAFDGISPGKCMQTGGDRRLSEWRGTTAMSVAPADAGRAGARSDDVEELMYTVGESLHATSGRADGEIAKKGTELLEAANDSHLLLFRLVAGAIGVNAARNDSKGEAEFEFDSAAPGEITSRTSPIALPDMFPTSPKLVERSLRGAADVSTGDFPLPPEAVEQAQIFTPHRSMGASPSIGSLRKGSPQDATKQNDIKQWLEAAISADAPESPQPGALELAAHQTRETRLPLSGEKHALPISRVSSLTRRSNGGLSSMSPSTTRGRRGGTRTAAAPSKLFSESTLRIQIPRKPKMSSPYRPAAGTYRKRKSSEREDEMQLPGGYGYRTDAGNTGRVGGLDGSKIPHEPSLVVESSFGKDSHAFVEMPAIRESRSSSASHESIPADAIPRDGLIADASASSAASEGAHTALMAGLMPATIAGVAADGASADTVWLMDRVSQFVDYTCYVREYASDGTSVDIEWSRVLQYAGDVSELSMFDELTVLYGRAGTRFTALATAPSSHSEGVSSTNHPAESQEGGTSDESTNRIDEAAYGQELGRPIARVPSWLYLDVNTPKASARYLDSAPPAPVPPDFGLLRYPPMSTGRIRTLTEEDAEAGLGLNEAANSSSGRYWYTGVDWSYFDASNRLEDSPSESCSNIHSLFAFLCHPAWTKLRFKQAGSLERLSRAVGKIFDNLRSIAAQDPAPRSLSADTSTPSATASRTTSERPTASTEATSAGIHWWDCRGDRCWVAGVAVWAEVYRACCVRWDHETQMELLSPGSGYSAALRRTRELPRSWRRCLHWLSQVIRCGAACTVSGPCVDFLYCRANTGRLSMWLATILFSLFMPWLMLAAVYLQNVCTLFVQRACLRRRAVDGDGRKLDLTAGRSTSRRHSEATNYMFSASASESDVAELEGASSMISRIRHREAILILYAMVLLTKLFTVVFTVEQAAQLRHPFHSEVMLVAPMVLHLSISENALPRATEWTWAAAMCAAAYVGVAAQQNLFHVSEMVRWFALVSVLANAVVVLRAWLSASSGATKVVKAIA